MAKRGSEFRLFGLKGKRKRRDYSRPELDWAVGDDNPDESLDLSESNTSSLFTLSSEKNGNRTDPYQVEELAKSDSQHNLVDDTQSASKYGHRPIPPKQGKLNRGSASTTPFAPRPSSAQSTSDASSVGKSTSPQAELSEPDVDLSMYAPGARRRSAEARIAAAEAESDAADSSESSATTSEPVSSESGSSESGSSESGSSESGSSESGSSESGSSESGSSESASGDRDTGDPLNGASAEFAKYAPKAKVETGTALQPRIRSVPANPAPANPAPASPVPEDDTSTADILPDRSIRTHATVVEPEREHGSFGHDDPGASQARRPNVPQGQDVLNAFGGSDGAKRIESIRLQLEKALEEWWGHSKLPSTALLRDGLLVLQSGHSLDEVHRTLLLRTSLAKRRGLLTAVRHQLDPDRTAFLIKDALLDPEHPFTAPDVEYLLEDYQPDEEWAELLLDELQFDLPQLDADRRGSVSSAIALLDQHLSEFRPAPLYSEPVYDLAVNGTQPLAISTPEREAVPLIIPRLEYWNIGRILLAILLIAVLISTWRWLQGRTTVADMVVIPTGTYVIGNSGPEAGDRSVSIAGYTIDRTEVTNGSYRLCYEQGECAAPVEISSQTRSSYFLNPSFRMYPVIYVDWEMANTYCTWAGKRLPTEEEWQIAASSALTTNRHFQYPWGERFNPLYANSIESSSGDTQQPGLYYPVGTSSAGAEDMAGNVAEWTSALDQYNEPNNSYVVKGGSYSDAREALRSSSRMSYPANFNAAWLGFRCAKSLSQ